jgi:hypothetical protein
MAQLGDTEGRQLVFLRGLIAARRRTICDEMQIPS